MFDRFWRSDPARTGVAGLGLAIARGLVEAQGGRIWAEGAATGRRARLVHPAARPLSRVSVPYAFLNGGNRCRTSPLCRSMTSNQR